jgi:hypothetical protein
MAHRKPNSNESDVIAEVQITNRNVSGYYTTVLPITWQQNSSKLFCSYSESGKPMLLPIYFRALLISFPSPFSAAHWLGGLCQVYSSGLLLCSPLSAGHQSR